MDTELFYLSLNRKKYENRASSGNNAASSMSTLMKCDNQSETELLPRMNNSDHIVPVISEDDSDIEILNDRNSMRNDDLKDADIAETVTQSNDQEKNVRRCPLSGRLMSSPWISNRCGHIFDGIYILKYLRCNAWKDDEAVVCPIENCDQMLTESNFTTLYETEYENAILTEAHPEWECDRCTFLNRKLDFISKCEMCGKCSMKI